MTPNPHFKGAPLFDFEYYLRNHTRETLWLLQTANRMWPIELWSNDLDPRSI